MEVAIDPTGEPGGVDPATGVSAMDLNAALGRLDPDGRALLPAGSSRVDSVPTTDTVGRAITPSHHHDKPPYRECCVPFG